MWKQIERGLNWSEPEKNDDIDEKVKIKLVLARVDQGRGWAKQKTNAKVWVFIWEVDGKTSQDLKSGAKDQLKSMC